MYVCYVCSSVLCMLLKMYIWHICFIPYKYNGYGLIHFLWCVSLLGSPSWPRTININYTITTNLKIGLMATSSCSRLKKSILTFFYSISNWSPPRQRKPATSTLWNEFKIPRWISWVGLLSNLKNCSAERDQLKRKRTIVTGKS